MRTKVMYKILENSPCGKDYFEETPHKKLAGEIAEYIKDSENGSVIGIDGDWGSGKSNLIKLVEGTLKQENKDKYHFFTYDAWEHQTDLPRRTLLEEIISYLLTDQYDGRPISRNEKLQRELDNLLGTKRITKAKTIPALGVTFVRELLFISIVFIAVSVIHLINSEWLESTWFKPSIYVCLSISVFIWAFFANRSLEKVLKDVYGEKISFMRSIVNFFLIGKEKITGDTTYETISERESTSREFKELFFEIDADLKSNDKVLMIALDDMDRLPKDKVRELWAVIISFFTEAKYSNIHVFVPFDRLHLRGAFQEEDIETRNDSKDGEGQLIFADDFINKTFTMVYSVPPPIMTSWMEYFEKKWKEAFLDKVKLDKAVLQIYDTLVKKHTPRAIVAFINQFVLMRNTCESDIEDKYIALYILGRDKIASDPLREILCPSYLGALAFLFKNDTNLSKCLSSLHFHLPKEKAMDIIYVREITKELNENSPSLLKTLNGNQKFKIINHSILNVNNIENATLALESVIDAEAYLDTVGVWNVLYHKNIELGSSNAISQEGLEYKEFHAILLSHIDDKLNYYKNLIRQYQQYIDKHRDDFDVMNYVNGVDRLKDIIGSNDETIIPSIAEVKPENYLKLMIEREDTFAQYGLFVKDEYLDLYLATLPEDEIAKFKLYPKLNGIHRLQMYKNKVLQLCDDYRTDKRQLEKFLVRVKEFDEKPIKMHTHWEEEQIYALAKDVQKGDKILPDVILMILSRWKGIKKYDLKAVFQTYFNSTEKELAQDVASQMNNYMDYGEWLLLLPNLNKSLIVEVARILSTNTCDIPYSKTKSILSVFDKISDASKIKTEVLLQRLSDNMDEIKKLTIADIKAFPEDVLKEMYRYSRYALSKHCDTLIKDHLAKLSKEEWKKILVKQNDNTIKLLMFKPLDQLPECMDAFRELMKNYALKTTNTRIHKRIVDMLVTNFMSVENVRLIFTEIRDIFINKVNIDKIRLIYFAECLLKYGKLGDNDLSLEKIFKVSLLDASIVKILKDNPTEMNAMIEAAEDASSFKSKLNTLSKTGANAITIPTLPNGNY